MNDVELDMLGSGLNKNLKIIKIAVKNGGLQESKIENFTNKLK